MTTGHHRSLRIFSGNIRAQQGFDGPTAFDGPPGWTVDKQQQTELYIVTHNLQLPNPDEGLHVVVTTKTQFVIPIVSVGKNSFTVTTWQLWAGMPQAPAPAATDFMFMAAHHT